MMSQNELSKICFIFAAVSIIKMAKKKKNAALLNHPKILQAWVPKLLQAPIIAQ